MVPAVPILEEEQLAAPYMHRGAWSFPCNFVRSQVLAPLLVERVACVPRPTSGEVVAFVDRASCANHGSGMGR